MKDDPVSESIPVDEIEGRVAAGAEAKIHLSGFSQICGSCRERKGGDSSKCGNCEIYNSIPTIIS